MVALVVLVVVAVLVALALRGKSGAGVRLPHAHTAGGHEDTLAAALHRAADARLITSAQAEAVLTAERGRRGAGATPARTRVPPVLEALGYLGGVFVMAGVITLVSQFWDDLHTWGRLTLLGPVAVALTAAGLLIRDEDEPVLWRLRGFLLLLGTGALAGFTAILLVDGFDVRDEPVVFGIGAAVTAHAGLLWWRRDRPAQHLACFGGVIVTLVGGLAWVGSALESETGPGPIGIALWVLGALWLAASLRHLLPPALVGIALGAATTLVAGAPMSASWEHAGALFGLATAAVLVGVGIRLDEFLVTGVGVLGTIVYLPIAVSLFFADTIGVPAVMLVSGLALLGLTLVLFKRRHGSGGGLTGGPSGLAHL